jgi:galactosyl transferase GMA12/MNN10 family
MCGNNLKKSKCILTAYDKCIASCSNFHEFIDNKKEYADKYNWDFICKTDEYFDQSKPSAFSKIKFIIDCLGSYNIVLWNDFDCLFTNFSIDITSILNDDEYIGVLEQEKYYFCTGNLLIKSNSYTMEFFLSLDKLGSWNTVKHPWEQTCFNEKIQSLNYKHLRRFKIDEFGSFCREGWWIIRPWQLGDFMVHISGMEWQERINTFLDIYKKQIVYV